MEIFIILRAFQHLLSPDANSRPTPGRRKIRYLCIIKRQILANKYPTGNKIPRINPSPLFRQKYNLWAIRKENDFIDSGAKGAPIKTGR